MSEEPVRWNGGSDQIDLDLEHLVDQIVDVCRGHDSLAVPALDRARLRIRQEQDRGGRSPGPVGWFKGWEGRRTP